MQLNKAKAMKRKLTAATAIALAVTLLLTACGALPVEPTPAEMTETPDVTSAETPVAAAPPEEAAGRAVPDTMALPDTPFEPESYWLAGPFGDGGQALLLMSADGRFKCWYNYFFEESGTGWEDIVGGSFTEAEAAAIVDGETLALEYCSASDKPRPERFTAITRAEALRAHRDMPYNDELSLPVPTRTGRDEWEATPGVRFLEQMGNFISYEYLGADVSYELWDGTLSLSCFTAGSPDFPFSVRGVGIGSSGEDVLASFPSDVLSLADAGEHHTFYGGLFGCMGAWNTGDDWRGDVIMVSDGRTITRFILDVDGTVYRIEFWNSVD